MNISWLCRGVCAVSAALVAGGASAAIQSVAPFRDGERVIFLGDSITHGGRYIGHLQFFWDARHPGSNVTLMGAGVSGDTAEGGLKRLEWDVLARNPDRVFILFGMNDVYRGTAWSNTASTAAVRDGHARIVGRYVTNMTAIVRGLKARHVEPVIMTPTPYDEYNGENLGIKKAADLRVNSIGLATLAFEARRLAADENLGLVELYFPMTEIVTRKLTRPLMPDRVHPNTEGHLVMAALILEAMGEKGVAPQTFDASGDARSFAYAPKTLPFPPFDGVEMARQLTPLFDAANREPLCFTGLPKGKWRLAADGRALGVFSSEELVRGVDAAQLDLPARRKARSLERARDIFQGRMGDCRSIAARRFFIGDTVDMEDEKAVRQKLDDILAENVRTKSPYYEYNKGVFKKFLKLYPRRHELAEAEFAARTNLAAVCASPAEPCTLTLEPVVELDEDPKKSDETPAKQGPR